MNIELVEVKRGLLMTEDQIFQTLVDYALGKIPDVIAETTMASGEVKPEDYMRMIAGNPSINDWLRHNLLGGRRIFQKGGVLVFDNVPGIIQYLGIDVEKTPYYQDYLVMFCNNRLRNDQTVTDKVEQAFSDYLKIERGIVLGVRAEIPVADGRFQVDWVPILERVKPIVFDDKFLGVTGNGLSGLVVYSVQTSGYPCSFMTRSDYDFVCQLSLVVGDGSGKVRHQWRVVGDTLHGIAEKDPVVLEFLLCRAVGGWRGHYPIMDKEAKEKARAVAEKLTAALRTI